MQRSQVLLAATLLALAFGARSTEAQQSNPGPARGEGKYTVVAGDQAVILIEPITGRTWYLAHAAHDHEVPVWLPIHRVDSPDEADEWREKQRSVAEKLEHHERELAQLDAQQQRDLLHIEETRRELEARVYELQRQREMKLYRSGPTHPGVREIDREIAFIERKLEELEEPIGHDAESAIQNDQPGPA